MRLSVVAMAGLVTLVGLAVCPAAARHFGRSDPSHVVIDEVAGVWCALALLPTAVLHEQSLLAVALAVGWFRVFDIAKPWPVSWLERIPGPASIMADDVAAGIIAGLVTTALLA
jgi:phosphatidylglycerophosphatase A